MTEAFFRSRRRQQFLTAKYFELNKLFLQDFIRGAPAVLATRKAEGDFEASLEGSVFKDSLRLVRLHYTAGEPIESLRPLYLKAVEALGDWHRAEDTYAMSLAKRSGERLRLDVSPLAFQDLFHFQIALDLVSLGLLLGEGEAVRRAAAWMQSTRGTDMMLEALLEPVVPDPRDVEVFFHVEPYDPLLDAIYTADTPEEASGYVKKYLDGWYKAFEGVPWHNGHLVQTPEYSNYEGYWAFEAAAVCVIHGIDDSSFRDHMVYPKDLADWAREHKVLDKIKPAAGSKPLQLRCEAGQLCPRTGHWFTPAKQDSTRLFSEGEKMPAVKDSPWGSTVWYWAGNQDRSAAHL